MTTGPILTVIISTFNEEKNIVGVIESIKKNLSIPYVINVWDTSSTDKTPFLAQQEGAEVIKHSPIKVVEEIRQKTIDQAKTDWVFILDADERITPQLGEQITNMVQKNKYQAISIPRLNYFFGQPLKYAGWWPDYQLRLFKKEAIHWPTKIHSQPIIKQGIQELKLGLNFYLIHLNYSSVSEFIDKMNRYTSIQAKELIENQSITTRELVVKPFDEFLSRYFYYQGYKGKTLGFSMSLLMAFYIFITYLKAYKLQNHSWYNPSPLENPKITKKLFSDYLHWRSQISPSFFSRLLSKLKLL